MDVQAAMGDGRTLRRIIALVVAFAALAELAAGRSPAIRWIVLLILRRADTVVASFVLAATGAPAADEALAARGFAPDDALRLAARFRALAAILAMLLPVDGRDPERGGFVADVRALAVFRFVGRTPMPCDTS